MSNPTERPPRFRRYGRTVGFRTGTAYGRPMSVTGVVKKRPPRFGRYGRTVGFRTGTAYGRLDEFLFYGYPL
jgi:hypothetical protein